MPRHWLFKSEPDVYGIDALAADGSTYWDGVRNYQARNLIRDEMKPGDLVLYYHSRIKPMGVVGLAEITSEGYPDPSQFDPDEHYFDPKATPEAPRWFVVDLKFVRRFDRVITLPEMKADPALEDMMVTRRGARLSVQPVSAEHFAHVLGLAGAAS
jgi:predicted RNA-binding protein with PUA-like domain